MTAFVAYDEISGEIRTWGDVDDPSAQEQHGSVLLGAGTNPTHYVAAGKLVAYTPDQAAAKAAQPAYTAVWSNTTFSWVDQRLLAQAQADQWATMKAARDAALSAGFAWNGHLFDSDDVSQQRIQGAVQLATLAIASGQTFTISWTLADNTTITLSAADTVSVGLMLGSFVQTTFAKGVTLRSNIDAATTLDQVKAVTWS